MFITLLKININEYVFDHCCVVIDTTHYSYFCLWIIDISET